MIDKDVAYETAELLLKIKAVSFRFNPPYTFTSGLKSPIYLDNRLVMSHPEVRGRITDLYLQAIRKHVGLANAEWISATASAAIPHGAWVADKLGLPLVYVRPTTKKYGKGNRIEGFLKRGSKVLVIEDHISTGTSAVENAKAIRSAGGKVRFCLATTTYETKESERFFRDNKLKLIVLTTGKMIVEKAFKDGHLTKREKERVDGWFKDPRNWAKRRKSLTRLFHR